MRYEILGPVEEAAPLTDKNALIEALLPALRQVESGGNNYAVSPAGAKGPFQFMDATAADVANQLGMTKYNIFDEKDAEPMARHYLGTLYDRYQDPELALAAYNYGMGNIDKRLKSAPERSFNAIADSLPKETRNYVPKVMGLIGEALVPSVQAEEPSQIAKPNPRYEILDEVPQNPRYEILGEDVPTEASQTGYSIQDAAAEVLDYLPFGKKAAAGLSALWNYDTPGQYEYAKQQLDENAQRFRDNAGKAAKFGAFATAAIPQAVAIPASATSTLVRALATGAGLGAGDALDDATLGKDAIIKGTAGATTGAGAGALGYFAPKLLAYGSEAKIPFVGKSVQDLFTGREGQAVGEKLLQERLTTLSDDELATAAKALKGAKKANSPLMLNEAIDKPNLTKQIKNIGMNDKTTNIAREALAERRLGQYDRLGKIMDRVSKIRGNDEATDLVVGKAKAIQESLTKAREDQTAPLFQQAYRETPTVEGIDDLLAVPAIKSAINSGTKDVGTVNLPENSTKLLNSVAAKLGDEVGALKEAKQFQAARDRMGTRVALKDVLDKIMPLKTANEEYAKLSIPLNKLKKAGFDSILKDDHGKLVGKENFVASKLGAKILDENTTIGKVRELKEAFGGDDEPIKAAVRSHIQNLFDRKSERIEGTDLVNIINTRKFKSKIRVLLGENDANKLIKSLNREVKIEKGYRDLMPRSDTFENEQGSIAEKVKELGAWVGKFSNAPIATTLKGASMLVGKGLPDSAYQDEARIIFSRDPAEQALVNILSRRGTSQKVDSSLQMLSDILTRGAIPYQVGKETSFINSHNPSLKSK